MAWLARKDTPHRLTSRRSVFPVSHPPALSPAVGRVSRARARTLKLYAMDPNVGVDYRNLGTDYQRFKASNDVAHKDPLP